MSTETKLAEFTYSFYGVSYKTTFYDNGDLDGANSIYLEQTVTMFSDFNEVKLTLSAESSLDSTRLRKMADEFDKAAIKAQVKQEELTNAT